VYGQGRKNESQVPEVGRLREGEKRGGDCMGGGKERIERKGIQEDKKKKRRREKRRKLFDGESLQKSIPPKKKGGTIRQSCQNI